MLLTWELMWTCSGLLFTRSLHPETLFCISEREEIFLAHTRFWRPIIFFPLTKLCNPKLQLIHSLVRHDSLLESSVQKTKNCVRKYLVLKHVNVKTQRGESTTTPTVHLGNKTSCTALTAGQDPPAEKTDFTFCRINRFTFDSCENCNKISSKRSWNQLNWRIVDYPGECCVFRSNNSEEIM